MPDDKFTGYLIYPKGTGVYVLELYEDGYYVTTLFIFTSFGISTIAIVPAGVRVGCGMVEKSTTAFISLGQDYHHHDSHVGFGMAASSKVLIDKSVSRLTGVETSVAAQKVTAGSHGSNVLYFRPCTRSSRCQHPS